MRPGIDVLLADSAHLIAGRRVGIITNQTGIDRDGVSDVARLLDASVKLTAIFSPEHGFRGTLDKEGIGNSTDSATGLPIYSLYGEHRKPTPEMLNSIDVLLIDLQDIGARPFTYISTALLAMRSAADADMPVIVLDRPNPIGGEIVQGPVLGREFASFVGMLPVALRHGMTVGELALLGNDELTIGARLTVVPAAGWRRSEWFDDTGLPWVKPSPNMPDLESATHYPGIVLFEGTNLSVGRGTPVAFQLVGAPWLDPAALIRRLNSEPGVEFSDTVVVPRVPGDGKYPDRPVRSVRLRVADRSRYDPIRLALRMMVLLTESYPDSFRITNEAYFDARSGSDSLRLGLERGTSWEEIYRSWQDSREQFAKRRKPYLIYP